MDEAHINTNIESGAIIHGPVGSGYVHIDKIIHIHEIHISNLAPSSVELRREPPQQTFDGKIPLPPYPGLNNFRAEHSAIFFGRDQAISRLEAAVNHHAFTAVVGASGSGKSSVVLAGLAPRLAEHDMWCFSHFRVGEQNDPFIALSRAVASLLGNQDKFDFLVQTQRLARHLESGEVSLPNVLGGCQVNNPGKRILIVADQFEEVFTHVGDELRRRRFIDVLLEGFPRNPDAGIPQASLIITLRADFYGSAVLHRGLADALQNRVENLGPMTRDELAEAIIRPAGGVAYEAGLVDRLLDDVDKNPGSLPLLQFALREMWRSQEHGLIKRHSYDAIGGICGALAQRAQDAFDAETEHGSNAYKTRSFRRLFMRLVTFGEGAFDARRVVDRTELDVDDWALAQRLANYDNRLLVTNADREHETAEFVHEALITNWPTLVEWIKEDRSFQSWLRQIKPSLDAWRLSPDDETRLLSGYSLATAKQWFMSRNHDLSVDERNYFSQSISVEEARKRKAIRIKRLILAGSLIALVVIVWAWWDTEKALREATRNYETAVRVATSVSQIVEATLLPNGATPSKSVLAKTLMDPLGAFTALHPTHETEDGALARLQLFEALWNNYYAMHDPKRASEVAQDELQIARQQDVGERDPMHDLDWVRYTARAEENLGANARDAGLLAVAYTHYEQAVRDAERLQNARVEIAEKSSVDLAKIPWQHELPHAHEYLGDILRDEGKLSEAEAEFKKFFELSAQLSPGDDLRWQREVAVVHGKLADMLVQSGDFQGAEKELKLDLALSNDLVARSPTTGDFQRGVDVAYERLGFVERSLHRLPEAFIDYKRDLDFGTKLLMTDPKNTQWRRDLALANEGLGDVLFEGGDIRGAQRYYENYAAVVEEYLKDPQSSARFRRDISLSHQRLGKALLALNEKSEAQEEFRKCISISEGVSNAFDPRNPEKDIGQACPEGVKLASK